MLEPPFTAAENTPLPPTVPLKLSASKSTFLSLFKPPMFGVNWSFFKRCDKLAVDGFRMYVVCRRNIFVPVPTIPAILFDIDNGFFNECFLPPLLFGLLSLLCELLLWFNVNLSLKLGRLSRLIFEPADFDSLELSLYIDSLSQLFERRFLPPFSNSSEFMVDASESGPFSPLTLTSNGRLGTDVAVNLPVPWHWVHSAVFGG